MQRSSLAKWALTRRLEAHVVLPGLLSLALIGMYFFGPLPVQVLVAPGTFELPFHDHRVFGLAHVVMGAWLAWILLLAVSILRMTRDPLVWLAAVSLGVLVVFSVLVWLDGHSLMSRASALWLMGSGERGPVSRFLEQQRGLLDLASVGLFSLVFFVIVPVVYGDRHHPVTQMLVPSRWLISTAAVMLASFWLAFQLQGQGWGPARSGDNATGASLSVFVHPVFLYMLLLYAARLQYRTWVRCEAGSWKRDLSL